MKDICNAERLAWQGFSRWADREQVLEIKMKARPVEGWQLVGVDGGVGLTFKLGMRMEDGSIEIVGDIPLLLTPDRCRLLADQLAEILDRLASPSASATNSA